MTSRALSALTRTNERHPKPSIHRTITLTTALSTEGLAREPLLDPCIVLHFCLTYTRHQLAQRRVEVIFRDEHFHFRWRSKFAQVVLGRKWERMGGVRGRTGIQLG